MVQFGCLGACILFKYKNLRADYVKTLWEVLDWKKVSDLYDQVVG